MSSLSQDSCPICMDTLPVAGSSNLVVTSCGHSFHTSCLLTNINHNGFDCPYCRNMLVEEKCEDSSSLSSIDVLSDESADEDSNLYIENVVHTDYMLRGLRLFWNRVLGTSEFLEDDIIEDLIDEMDDIQVSSSFPSASRMHTDFFEHGISSLDLVKVILYRHLYTTVSLSSYEYVEYERLSRRIRERINSHLI